jgi:hypothetical protein
VISLDSRSAFVAIFLLPGIAVAGGSAQQKLCSEQLLESTALAQETLLRNRVGLTESLRSLRDSCETEEASARDAAQAAFLYLTLPEFTSPESQLRVLELVEERLRSEPNVDSILVDVLDRKGGVLFSMGRLEHSLEAFEVAREERSARFGEGSFEESMGYISLAQYYSSLAEKRDPEENRRQAIELGEEAMNGIWRARGENDRQTKEILVQFKALLESVGVPKEEAAGIVKKYNLPPSNRP